MKGLPYAYDRFDERTVVGDTVIYVSSSSHRPTMQRRTVTSIHGSSPDHIDVRFGLDGNRPMVAPYNIALLNPDL